MSFEIRDKELAGRIGRLYTKSGVIETPAFFPVINPFRQDVPSQKIWEIGFQQIITNSYIIKQRLGGEAKVLGVHKIASFNGVVMTDSGAYQLLMYGGERVSIDPVEIVEFQKAIGSDIAVIADIPTRDDAPYEEAEESVRETLRRAEEVIPYIRGTDTVWVLPIQGGVHTELVDLSSRKAVELEGYGMYAIGSPVTVLEKYGFWRIVRMVATAKKNLPPDKPVHLFGGGHPLIIPIMVGLGIDSFDSASYVLYAREGRYITEHGTYRVNEMEYFPCECEVCSKYTPKELLQLDKRERTRLLAIHNLHVINREIKRVKEAIKEGRLWELIEERARTHPSVREALNEFIRYSRWIESFDMRVRGRARGMFLFDTTSYYRPELVRHRNYLDRKYVASRKRVILIPADPEEKPFRASSLYRRAVERGVVGNGDEVIFYLPFFDLVPKDLDQTYPYAQFEMPKNPPVEVVMEMLNRITDFYEAKLKGRVDVVLVVCKDIPWAEKEVIGPSLKGKVKVVEAC